MDRTLDKIIACIFIALTLPLTVIVALAIRLDIRGLVFFEGDRLDLCHSYRNRLFRFPPGDKSYRARGVAALARVGQFLYVTRIENLPHLFDMLHSNLTPFSKRCVIC